MAQLITKQGVILKYFTRPMIRMLGAVMDTWDYALGTQPVVTSAFDGKHKKNSLHYSGLALDFRTNSISPEKAKEWADRLRKVLGSKYDVILEIDHLHVEYDPKEGKSAES